MVEAYIRPLKIKDSVPKYRVPIQTILAAWAEDEALLTALSNAALQDRRGAALADCRRDLLQKMFAVKDWYDSIESDYLDEIDRQVRRYTRATTQKLENLTNRDFSVREISIIFSMPWAESSTIPSWWIGFSRPFQIYEQSFLSEHSLWYRRRPGKRGKTAPVLIEEPELDAAAEAQALQCFEQSMEGLPLRHTWNNGWAMTASATPRTWG